MPAEFDALLKSDAVTPRTREVLFERLKEAADESYEPKFFSKDEFELLTAIAGTIVPDCTFLKFTAGCLDTRLFNNEGKGWRYATLPPEREMFHAGLAQIRAAAPDFARRSVTERTQILRDLFETGAENHFWEELLVDIIEAHYSHPAVQAEIGALGMADDNG